MIHNIFKKFSSKSPTNSKPIPKVIIDVHEKDSLVPSSLHELGCEIEFKSLKVGDCAPIEGVEIVSDKDTVLVIIAVPTKEEEVVEEVVEEELMAEEEGPEVIRKEKEEAEEEKEKEKK